MTSASRMFAVIALAAMVLGGACGAQAGELRTSDTPDPAPATTGAVDHATEAVSVRPGPAADAVRQSAMPEAKPVPAPVMKVAEPWCRSGRVAGSGAGFCLIN